MFSALLVPQRTNIVWGPAPTLSSFFTLHDPSHSCVCELIFQTQEHSRACRLVAGLVAAHLQTTGPMVMVAPQTFRSNE